MIINWQSFYLVLDHLYHYYDDDLTISPILVIVDLDFYHQLINY